MRLGLAALLLPALAACGGGDNTDAGGQGDTYPDCTEFFTSGDELTDGFEGCEDEDGDLQVGLIYNGCEGGKEMYVVSGFGWGFVGEVPTADDSDDNGNALAACHPDTFD